MCQEGKAWDFTRDIIFKPAVPNIIMAEPESFERRKKKYRSYKKGVHRKFKKKGWNKL